MFGNRNGGIICYFYLKFTCKQFTAHQASTTTKQIWRIKSLSYPCFWQPSKINSVLQELRISANSESFSRKYFAWDSFKKILLDLSKNPLQITISKFAKNWFCKFHLKASWCWKYEISWSCCQKYLPAACLHFWQISMSSLSNKFVKWKNVWIFFS